MKKRLYLTGDPVLSEFIRKNPKKSRRALARAVSAKYHTGFTGKL